MTRVTLFIPADNYKDDLDLNLEQTSPIDVMFAAVGQGHRPQIGSIWKMTKSSRVNKTLLTPPQHFQSLSICGVIEDDTLELIEYPL